MNDYFGIAADIHAKNLDLGEDDFIKAFVDRLIMEQSADPGTDLWHEYHDAFENSAKLLWQQMITTQVEP